MKGLATQFKADALAAVVEFFGTLLFLLIGLGGISAAVNANAVNKTPKLSKADDVPDVQTLIYISSCMSMSLLATGWIFFRVSGSIFNPNVGLALLLVGAVKPMRFALCAVAEVLGSVAASGLLQVLLPGPLAVNCGLGKGVSPLQGLVIEAFLTAALTLTVLFVAVEKHRSTPFAPCAIGAVLFAAHMFGVTYTGAALNTARAFGPAFVTNLASDHWVYWLGPTLGALAATGVYRMLKYLDYSQLVPGQDCDCVEVTSKPSLGLSDLESCGSRDLVDGLKE